MFRRAYGIHFSRRLEIDRRSGPSLLQSQHALFDAADNLVVLLVVFEKIGNVQEGVAIEANVDKRRLHARQHASHPAFVNAARQRVFLLALKIDLNQLVVFEDRHSRLVAIRRYH